MPQTPPLSPGPISVEAPIYPDVEVRVRSRHPLVWVSSVRYALRRAGVDAEQIDRFSSEALTARSGRCQRQICTHWVTVCA